MSHVRQAMSQRLYELTADLAARPGVSGFEQPVVRRLVELFGPWVDDVGVDEVGNVYAWRRAAGGGEPTLMIAAHSDEIGMVVQHIEPDGFLRFAVLGGVADGLLPGRAVSVRGVPGVIGIKAGHFQNAEDRHKVRPHHELYIDLGLDSAEAVAQLGVRVGDPITWEQPLFRLAGDRICGKAIDNRLGCAVLVVLAETLRSEKVACNLCFTVNIQEEVGLRGAQQTAQRIRPDAFIAVDTIPCGGTPDVPTYLSATGIGRGPVIPVVNGGPRGLITHPALLAQIREAAAALGVQTQETLFYGGSNDAAAAFLAAGGIPAASVCLPRRYAHSPVECADLRDAVGAVGLLTQLIRGFSNSSRAFL